MVESDKPKQTKDVVKAQNDIFRGSVARTGLLVPMFLVFSFHKEGEQPKEFKVDDEFKVSDFKLGKKEKVGDQEAQVIEYNLHLKTMDQPLNVSVWVDTKTHL